MNENEKVFTNEERRTIALNALKRLIANVESLRRLENKELAETITVCIQQASSSQLETLKLLIEQQELKRPAWGKTSSE